VALQEAIEEDYPYGRRSFARMDDRLEPIPVYEFISADRYWKISICSDFFQLTTTDYEVRGDFPEELKPTVHRFADLYGQNATIATVLYYRGVIDREDLGLEVVPWHELLNPAVAGEIADEHLEEDEIVGLQRNLTLDLRDGNLPFVTILVMSKR